MQNQPTFGNILYAENEFPVSASLSLVIVVNTVKDLLMNGFPSIFDTMAVPSRGLPPSFRCWSSARA